MNIELLNSKLKSITVGFKDSKYGYTTRDNILDVLSLHELNYCIAKGLIEHHKTDSKILKVNII